MTGPRVRRFAELSEGTWATTRFTVDAARLDAFAALSGDRNPLHTDAAYARLRGHRGCVVHGALLVAELSRLIGMELPGRNAMWTHVDMRFHAPLYLDEEATVEAEVVHASAATRSVELRVRVRVTAGDRLIARGRAGASVLDDG